MCRIKRKALEFMFSHLSVRVLERMWGRKLPVIVAAASDGGVTERTVRNWMASSTVPDAARLAALRLRSRAWFERYLAEKGWSTTECKLLSQGLNECPGLISGLVFSLQGPCALYPESLQLARQIDLLELRLEAHRVAGDVDAFVEELLATEWFGDEHFMNPDNGDGAEVARIQLRAATSWQDVILPVTVLIVNTHLQLLATLDLEFCGRYLVGFAATPVFTGLLPRLALNFDSSADVPLAVRRDTFHYPIRRLLDVMACMRATYRHRKWPQRVPTVEDVAAWTGTAPSTLTKWRMGRVFTMSQFLRVWEELFAFVAAPEQPAAPTPLMYAALVFTELLVKGSREGRDLRFTTIDPSAYTRWWEIQNRKLHAEAPTLRFGTRAWMPGLL